MVQKHMAIGCNAPKKTEHNVHSSFIDKTYQMPSQPVCEPFVILFYVCPHVNNRTGIRWNNMLYMILCTPIPRTIVSDLLACQNSHLSDYKHFVLVTFSFNFFSLYSCVLIVAKKCLGIDYIAVVVYICSVYTYVFYIIAVSCVLFLK